MEFTPLERAVLDWIAEHADDPAVKQQLAAARPVSREFTGVGSFTSLRVPHDSPRVPYTVSPTDPVIESPQLEHGAGSVLFFEDGLASTLELYSNGDSFPEVRSFRLLPWDSGDSTA